jgi:hypothetical protein
MVILIHNVLIEGGVNMRLSSIVNIGSIGDWISHAERIFVKAEVGLIDCNHDPQRTTHETVLLEEMVLTLK